VRSAAAPVLLGRKGLEVPQWAGMGGGIRQAALGGGRRSALNGVR